MNNPINITYKNKFDLIKFIIDECIDDIQYGNALEILDEILYDYNEDYDL